MIDTSNNRISTLVSSHLPAFIRDDHETFVYFLQAYYQFLEQSGEVSDLSNNLIEYFDIDKTLSSFADHLYNEFIQSIPKNIEADKSIVLKYIKDFYRSKGSEKSLKFLLRIIENTDPTIYYPKKDILRTDDGKWFVQKSLRINNVSLDGVANTDLSGMSLLINKRIKGLSSNASATIDRVDRFYEYGEQINELILSNISDSFQSGEQIISFINSNNVTNLTANIESAGILDLKIINGGYGYSIGNPVIFESSNGSGAYAYVSAVSPGNVANISVVYSGAGFLVGDSVLITGPGSGATASVSSVDDSETYHPNSFTVYTTSFADLANTQIDAADYANLSHAIISSPNANSVIQDTLTSFVYGPCGPIDVITVATGGSGYSSIPLLSVYANTAVQSMGILGRMDIIDGGTGYANTDTIEFINVPLGAGTGAAGTINVDGSGTITSVAFSEVTGFPIGGLGFSQSYLPIANVVTSTGSGANIAVTSIIGDGEQLLGFAGSLGTITSISISNRGSGYVSPPTINLSGYGSGTAQVTANIISGIYSYPGRYINDDGFVSAYNFLENQDYYQNYSYVVKSTQVLNKYKQAVLNLVHPSGTKLFGVYITNSNISSQSNVASTSAKTISYLAWMEGLLTWKAAYLAVGTEEYTV